MPLGLRRRLEALEQREACASFVPMNKTLFIEGDNLPTDSGRVLVVRGVGPTDADSRRSRLEIVESNAEA